MRISFGLKLGLSITVLTVGISTASLSYFYSITSNLVIEQIKGRLQDIGSTSTFLFSHEDRESIVKLKAKIDKDAQFSMAELKKVPSGGTLNSLTPENIRKYQSTKEFKIHQHRDHCHCFYSVSLAFNSLGSLFRASN